MLTAELSVCMVAAGCEGCSIVTANRSQQDNFPSCHWPFKLYGHVHAAVLCQGLCCLADPDSEASSDLLHLPSCLGTRQSNFAASPEPFAMAPKAEKKPAKKVVPKSKGGKKKAAKVCPVPCLLYL